MDILDIAHIAYNSYYCLVELESYEMNILFIPLKLTNYLDIFYKVLLNQSLISVFLLSGSKKSSKINDLQDFRY